VDPTRSWSFASDSVADACTVRIAIRRFLEASADPATSDLDAAELIVGELIANVVRHGGAPFGVCVDWSEDIPMLYVSDRGCPRKPLLYSAPDHAAERGRGLLLVRALAQGEVILDAPRGQRGGTRVAVALPVRHRGSGAERGPTPLRARPR
jgi:anti-sigma regulatory factor (Ser/Thr protein kinase)